MLSIGELTLDLSTSSSPVTPKLCTIKESLESVLEKTTQFDFYELEESFNEFSFHAMREKTIALADLAMDGVRGMVEGYEHVEEGDGEHVRDFAHLALLEIGNKRENVYRLRFQGQENLDVIVGLSECIGRIAELTADLKNIIDEAEGKPAKPLDMTRVEAAVWTRQKYASLRHLLLKSLPVNEKNLRQALLGLTDFLGSVLASKKSRNFRTSDRVQLRNIQRKIKQWLAMAKPDAQSGLEVWHDMLICSELLMEVNRRTVLVESDHKVAFVLGDRLGSLGEHDDLPETMRPLTWWLAGKSYPLDALLLEGRAIRTGMVKSLVQKVLDLN